MLMVCVLHINLSGQYKQTYREGVWEWLSWGGSESLCIMAVDLYAMITGYVCITSSWRISRYIDLWFQVAFYTVGFYSLGGFLIYAGWIPCPELKRVLPHLCTVPLAGAYWYFNAYTALFLLIPFLNKLLRQLTRADYTKLLAVLLVFLPLMQSYGGGFSGGYNAGWLGSLYCAGAFFRLHPLPVRRPSLCLLFYLLGAAGFFLLLPYRPDGIRDALLSMGYASPFHIVATLSLFLIFEGIDIKQPWQKKAIRFVAPLTFGVYLVQCHPIVMRFLFSQGEQFITKYGHPVWVPLVGGLSLFIACACVDWVRLHIFRWCHTRALADKLETALIRIWRLVRARCRGIVIGAPRLP